ncbi:MAG TPA: hypothetical protein VFD91_12455 [Mariniphaga sp.]|nr:hypothetical protein [Mariniphaga sp.]
MEKDKIRDRIKKSIDDLFAAIDDLDSRKDEVKGKSKEKFQEILAEIKRLESILENKSRQAREGDDPSWEEAKRSFKQSAHSFREALENLIAFLRKDPPEKNNDQRPEYEI